MATSSQEESVNSKSGTGKERAADTALGRGFGEFRRSTRLLEHRPNKTILPKYVVSVSRWT